MFLRATSLACFFVASVTSAAEVDNYTTRNLKEIDSTAILNQFFNEELDAVIARLPGNSTPVQVTLEYMRAVDNIPVLNRITGEFRSRGGVIQEVDGSLYDSSSCFAKAALKVRPLAGILFVAGVPIGIDKIGHFHDSGSAIYKRVFVKGKSLEEALRWARNTEQTFLGTAVIGVFANADMVANYEGFRFYRNLFAVDEVTGKGPVLSIVDGRIIKNRAVDLADHVNSYWNEAMNPSWMLGCLDRHLKATLPALCDQFDARPDFYVPVGEDELERRYARIGLKPEPALRMDRICTSRRRG